MKQDPRLVLIIFIGFLCLLTIPAVSAADVMNVSEILHGGRYIIILVSTVLAVALTIISFIGYRRDGRKRVLLITLAFFIFSLKGVFVLSGDILLRRGDPFFDIVESLLDFGILACIFFGML